MTTRTQQEIFETFTLERLLKRTESRGACLAWTGHSNGNNPQVRLGGKEGQVYNVRRVIFTLVRGEKAIRPGHQIGIRASCTCELCVHPDHLASRSKSAAQSGRPAPLARKIRIAATKRKKSTLTIETVRAIRGSEEPGIVLDERFGLTKGYASKIRRGRVWQDHANPFARMESSTC